ncbi:MAG: ribbon-helix-helix domain-containing protein [Patescibacteria group bacterium]
MRNIINISLPSNMRREVETAVKDGDYASKSEFFRDLLRMWRHRELIGDLEASEREFAAGKGKRLRSLRDLR